MTSKGQHQQYLRTQIQTASKEQLVLMLYDGVIRFSELGRKAINEKNIAEGHNHLTRTQDIVLELLYGLDRDQGGEIAENLAKLYGFCMQSLVDANLHKDTTKIDDVQRIFRDLRDAWAQAMTIAKSEAAPVQSTEKISLEAATSAKPKVDTSCKIPQAYAKPGATAQQVTSSAALRPNFTPPPIATQSRLSVQG